MTFDRAVVDHELDVVRPGPRELSDDIDRLLGRRHLCAHDRVDPRTPARAARTAAATTGSALRVEVLREQLLGVTTGRGEAEAGGADVGKAVILGDVVAIVGRVGPLHLELGGHAELQRHPKARGIRVHVSVDEAGEKRRPSGIDDLGIRRSVGSDGLDDTVGDDHGLLTEIGRAIEYPAGEDCSAHANSLFLRVPAEWRNSHMCRVAPM